MMPGAYWFSNNCDFVLFYATHAIEVRIKWALQRYFVNYDHGIF